MQLNIRLIQSGYYEDNICLKLVPENKIERLLEINIQ